MNLVLIIVGIIFLLCAISGVAAGFLRKASGILSLVLAGFLVTAILPYVSGWLHDSTPVYSLLQEQCAKIGADLVKGTVSGEIGNALNGTSSSGSLFGLGSQDSSTSGSPSGNGSSGSSAYGGSSGIDAILNSDGSVNRSMVKSLLEQYGYDASLIDNMSDDQIKSLISQYVGVSAGTIDLAAAQVLTIDLMADGSGAYDTSADGVGIDDSASGDTTGKSEAEILLSQLMDGMSSADKRRFIESLPIPASLQEQMETFNNSEGYKKLGAYDFASYVTGYFASLILNVIAYLITFLIAWIIIRLIIGALGIFTRLPLIGAADRILGLGLGLVQALFIVWVLFLILSLLAGTPFGQNLMNQIYASPFLETLYNTNIFMKGAGSAMKGIL